jgi:radical SAM-linked protein
MSAAHQPEFRLRVEYAKRGRGAYLSHLEVIRTLERIVRRAWLPFASTQGFSPHMKISFGPALGVGTASRSEHFDVILNEYFDPHDALERLTGAAPDVLSVVDADYVSAKEPSLSAAVTILQYQVIVAGHLDPPTEMPATLTVEQKGKTKSYDTHEVLPEGISVIHGDDATVIGFIIRSTAHGTLRPDSLMDYLIGDGHDVSYSIERTAALIEEKDGTWRAPLR